MLRWNGGASPCVSTATNPAEVLTHGSGGLDAGDQHGSECGHDAIPYGDYHDDLVTGRLHRRHDDHCGDHGPIEVVIARELAPSIVMTSAPDQRGPGRLLRSGGVRMDAVVRCGLAARVACPSGGRWCRAVSPPYRYTRTVQMVLVLPSAVAYDARIACFARGVIDRGWVARTVRPERTRDLQQHSGGDEAQTCMWALWSVRSQ